VRRLQPIGWPRSRAGTPERARPIRCRDHRQSQRRLCCIKSSLRELPACHTPLMAFHSDFWVAIATSAPVIGLGAVLPLANSLVSNVSDDFPGEPPTPFDYSLGNAVPLVSAINLVLQVVALWDALNSLSSDRDWSPRSGAILLQTAGIGLLLLAALLSALYKWRRQLNRRTARVRTAGTR
jgi:hypothetical protein